MPYTFMVMLGHIMGCAGNASDWNVNTSQVSANDGVPFAQSSAGSSANIVADPNVTNTSTSGQLESGMTSTGVLVMTLQGCLSSDYTAKVRLGDGLVYKMTVDTGSATLAVAKSGCRNCSGVSPTYTPGPHAVDDNAMTGGAYGDGSSWSGEVFTDTVSLGSSDDITMVFAAIDKQLMSRDSGRNFFNPSYCSGTAVSNTSQGIIGFGGKNLALAHTDAFLDVLHASSRLPDVFATQLCDMGGTLWLGGYDANTMSKEPSFTPMSVSTGFYQVTLQDMQLGGLPLGSSDSYGTAIVDTGTSVMITDSALFDTTGATLDNDARFVSYFGPGFLADGSCSMPAKAITRAALDAELPQLTLEFPDAQGEMFETTLTATESYLMAALQPDGTLGYCPGIASGGGTGGLPNLILGNSLLHSQIAIFDRGGMRLGLAPEVGCGHLENGGQ